MAVAKLGRPPGQSLIGLTLEMALPAHAELVKFVDDAEVDRGVDRLDGFHQLDRVVLGAVDVHTDGIKPEVTMMEDPVSQVRALVLCDRAQHHPICHERTLPTPLRSQPRRLGNLGV